MHRSMPNCDDAVSETTRRAEACRAETSHAAAVSSLEYANLCLYLRALHMRLLVLERGRHLWEADTTGVW